VKVTVVTTLKEGLTVGMRSMPGNLYGDHILDEAIKQVDILTKHRLPLFAGIAKKVNDICSACVERAHSTQ